MTQKWYRCERELFRGLGDSKWAEVPRDMRELVSRNQWRTMGRAGRVVDLIRS
jgi:hypothetical protein